MEPKVGDKVMMHGRMIYLGEVVEVSVLEVTLIKACWMASMGRRMADLMARGCNSETRVEVYPPDLRVAIPRGGFARHEWKHALPEKSQP
jgi:hypothetical protein